MYFPNLTYNIQAQISTHDQVATREYPLQSVADNEDELIEEQALRTIYIEKKSDTLVSTLSPISTAWIKEFHC